MTKYALAPDCIISKSDGQLHYIDAWRLAKLYGVEMRDCIIVRPSDRDLPKGIPILRPRWDGNYKIPSGEGDQS